MIPKNFTVAEIDELISAKNYVFSGKQFPLKILSQEIKKIVGKLEWLNGSDLVSDLQKITNTDSLEKTEKILSDWKQEISEKSVESTVPQKEQLENLEEEAERREKTKQETIAAAEKKTEEFIKIQKAKAEKIYLEPKEKTPETVLTEQDNIALGKLIQSAESDPKTFVENMSKEISTKTGADLESSQVAALDFYAKIDTKIEDVPPSAFLAIAYSQESPEIIEASLTFAQLYEKKNQELRALIGPVLGDKLTQVFYPVGNQEFNVTNEKTERSEYEIDLNQLKSDYQNFQSSPILDQIKNQGKSIIKDWVAGKIEALPAQSALRGFVSRAKSSQLFKQALPFLGLAPATEVVATSFVGKTVQLFFPKFAPSIANFATKLGINIGLKAAAPVVAEAVGTTAVKALGTNLGKIAAGALLKLGISVPASFIPGLNIALWAYTIISILSDLGKFLKQFGPKIKQWLSDNAPLLIGIGAVGLFLGNPIMTGLGLISISAGLLSGASPVGIARRTIFFFGRLGTSMAITIGTPIIVAIVVFPILVAIILFIINSGAYIVPPRSSLVGIAAENPYIGIEKIATPSGPFSNTTQVITYEVAITAKKGVLTSIVIEDECKAISESGSTTCPAVDIPTAPDSISPAIPFSFNYTTTYDAGNYSDSIIINNINVSAIADNSQQSVSGSTSIIMGKPPSACLVLEGEWPDKYKALIDSAISTLSSSFPVYMSKVCSSGAAISVVFSQTCPLGWSCLGAWVNGKIYLMPGALNLGETYTLFTLAHETGHYLQDMTAVGYALYSEYSGTISPPDICSYRNTIGNYSESFAETIGRYASNYSSGCFAGSFKSAYPKNWQFANDKIFK